MIDLGSIASIHNKPGVSAEWLLFNRGPMFWRWEQKQKKIKEKSQDTVSFAGELEEMVTQMKHIPLPRYAIMGYYQEFKIENDDLIRQFLENEGKAETSGEIIHLAP